MKYTMKDFSKVTLTGCTADEFNQFASQEIHTEAINKAINYQMEEHEFAHNCINELNPQDLILNFDFEDNRHLITITDTSKNICLEDDIDCWIEVVTEERVLFEDSL